MKFFNTSGPVNPEDHYCLAPLERFDLPNLMRLIAQKKYFVLHAPRQTGKTSSMLALMEHLNQSGKYRALYINVEIAQAAREDVQEGMRAILNELASRSRFFLNDSFFSDNVPKIVENVGTHAMLNEALSRWAMDGQRPIVLIIDEIDSLVGDTLIAVLRQLRAGYDKRPDAFPQTVILCGVRDVRDYRMHPKGKEIITGGSAFNVKDKSLRLGNFSENDVKALLLQHTAATGQRFEPEALDLIWRLTCGQPWLVNALAEETCFEMAESRDRDRPITAEAVRLAKEQIILERRTHLDQLADKLKEDRVRRVIEPILAGKSLAASFLSDDVQYGVDLGLIEQKINGEIRIANLIYQEVIPRQLSWDIQSGMSIQAAWYMHPSGRIDMEKLLEAFQAFFREHSEHWVERFQYKEAGPQLLLQAFLQRVVNGGGRIDREYGLGLMRTDLLVTWPYAEGVQKVVIELKLLHKSLNSTIAEGLAQCFAYMDRCGTEDGYLLIFDRTSKKTWGQKIFVRQKQYKGKMIKIYGM